MEDGREQRVMKELQDIFDDRKAVYGRMLALHVKIAELEELAKVQGKG
jgi:hypothetical protein